MKSGEICDITQLNYLITFIRDKLAFYGSQKNELISS